MTVPSPKPLASMARRNASSDDPVSFNGSGRAGSSIEKVPCSYKVYDHTLPTNHYNTLWDSSSPIRNKPLIN